MNSLSSDEALIKWQVANSNLDRLTQDEVATLEQIATLEQNTKDWTGAKILLELLKNYKLEKRKDFILTIVNSAIRDIFEADYRLDILPRDTKGKSVASNQKYDIIFYQNGIEIAKNNELLTSNGGGVLSIASLFFKILIGYLYSKNKFYIFDESLSQVSPKYRSRLSAFLKKFCDQYQFTLVVVSQTEELEEHAHLVYEVDSSVDADNIPVLDIVKIEGDIPQVDFFYSRIKNFQSIVNQKFIFKGFTIIRGPNNSGKSASLRAIEALLFNNFKTDTYPRKNPSGRKHTTEITFGYVSKEGQKEIALKYRSGKVMFIIEGNEYFGKSLAADKLKEAVEEIGFRYIDVKQMYKNFKGPLKEQTERIAYTNQYDGLFLIGAKTSDSEKIFSFLFNTENIALAIAQAKEAIQTFGQEHKKLSKDLIELQHALIEAKLKVDYYIKLYYYSMILELDQIKKDSALKKEEGKVYTKLLQGYNDYIYILEAGNWLQETSNVIDSQTNKRKHNNTQIELIDQITQKWDDYKEVQSLKSLSYQTQKLRNTKTLIDRIIPKLEGSLTLLTYFDLTKSKDLLNVKVSESVENRRNLDSEYHLQICHQCDGMGVEPS